jgi:hypothetical protein
MSVKMTIRDSRRVITTNARVCVRFLHRVILALSENTYHFDYLFA